MAIAAGCSRELASPRVEAPRPAPGAAPTARVETEHFVVTLPAGYADATAELASSPRHALALRATSDGGAPAIIVVQKAPLPGGSFADASTCAQTGRGLVAGGTDDQGTGGTLLSAGLVDGPLGTTCQIRLRASGTIALITELHAPGNSPSTPKDLWLMTCNHAEGDGRAESACRVALAGFRLRGR